MLVSSFPSPVRFSLDNYSECISVTRVRASGMQPVVPSRLWARCREARVIKNHITPVAWLSGPSGLSGNTVIGYQ